MNSKIDDGNWIHYFRSSLDHPLFRKPAVWHTWTYCLLKACFRPVSVFWKGKRITVPVGSFITSLSKINEVTGLSFQQIRTALRILEAEGNLTIESTKSGHLVKVNNWGKFQGNGENSNKDSNNQLTNNKQRRSPEPLPDKASEAPKKERKNLVMKILTDLLVRTLQILTMKR